MKRKDQPAKGHTFTLISPPLGAVIPGLLLIDSVTYRSCRCKPDPRTGCVALVRLEKLNSRMQVEKHYDCALMNDGRHDCDCGDFGFRASKRGEPCKHLQALLKFDLLTRPQGVESILLAALNWIVDNATDTEAVKIARSALIEADAETPMPAPAETPAETPVETPKVPAREPVPIEDEFEHA